MNLERQAASFDEAQVLQDNIEELADHLECLTASYMGPAVDPTGPAARHAAIKAKAIVDPEKQLAEARVNQIIRWKCSAA